MSFLHKNVSAASAGGTLVKRETQLVSVKATSLNTLYAESPFNFTVIGEGVTTPSSIVVRKDGAGDYTKIQDAIDVASPNDVIEVQTQIPGGDEIFNENLLITNKNYSSGNEVTLRVRLGDKVRIFSPTVSGTILFISNSSFWIIDNFTQFGKNTWTNETPIEVVRPWEHTYGLRCDNGSNHIDYRNIGNRSRLNDDKLFGANNFSANQCGDFGRHDGVHHIRYLNCHFSLHGNNNNVGHLGGGIDWGDLLRVAAPNSVVDGCTFNQSGHNGLSIEEGRVYITNCIVDSDWTNRNTGWPGYRPMEISGDKADITANFIVSERNVYRNALSGPNNAYAPAAKYQTRRGIFRHDTLIKSQGHGMLASRNRGESGTVTQSKWYNITEFETNSVFRQVQAVAGYDDLFVEQSWVNCLFQRLGSGDNLSPGSYVYKRDLTTRAGYPTGWKGDEWHGITVQTDNLNGFNILLDDDTGNAQVKTLAQALVDWSDNFFDWDVQTVSFTDESEFLTSWDIDVIRAGVNPISGGSVLDIKPLTVMVGAGASATSGVVTDARFFALLDSDLDLSYFGYQNDQIKIGTNIVRLQTIDKSTGAITWDNPITWADGEGVAYVPPWLGDAAIKRGSSQ